MVKWYDGLTAEPVEVTEDLYWEALEVMPPIYRKGCFGVGEPLRHTATGEVVTYWFASRGGSFYGMVGTSGEAEAAFAKPSA